MRAGAMLITLAACGPTPPARGRDAAPPPVEDAPPATASCKVQDDSNGVGACDQEAPPNSFQAALQWSWTGPGAERSSIVTPLVANLTDDNADGAIDLCDVPDIVVLATDGTGSPGSQGHLYLLDGRTGAQELMIATLLDATVTPALGDLDHDGVPDLVAVDPTGKLWGFDHRGTRLFGPAGQWAGDWYGGALALADLDGDGEVEIVGGNTVFDHTGTVRWSAAHTQATWNATAIADLDGDGLQEVVLGAAAYHHDGQLYWETTLLAGYPQVANLDADPQPEVLVTNANGLSVVEHDGIVKYRDKRPTGAPVGSTTWIRPATIHDFDANGTVEFAMSSASSYTLYNADATIRWSAPVSDGSGIAAGTAFDFLGDGSAEAMYADEQELFVFGPTGEPLLHMPRNSATLTEYPVVADVDNDGSAEIVVVSNGSAPTISPTVQVIRDQQDRWIQARRIWNQHTYHVTNVREDGTIPRHEPASWTRLGTFRTNAQINSSGVCQPPIL